MNWLRQTWDRSFDDYSYEDNFKWEIRFAHFAFWPAGIWPESGKMAVVRLMLVLAAVGQYLLLIIRGPPLLNILAMGSVVAGLTFAITFLYANGNILRSILEEMRENWKTNSTEERKIMHYYARRSRRISWAVFIGKAGVLNIGALLVERGRRTNESPADDESQNLSISRIWSWTTHIMGKIGLWDVRITETGFVLCFVLLTVHACGQLAKLGNRLRGFEGQIRHSWEDDILEGCSCLKCIVDSHIKTYEFVARIDSYYHKTMFCQLSQSVIQFALCGYFLTEAFVARDYSGLVNQLIYILMNLPTIFIYCWMADRVQQASEAIGDVAYSVKWMTKDPKISRNLMFIIRHSRIPPKLTAGKFFVLSLELFKEYCSTSISYISVLLNIKLRQ